ncbi:MAG: S53 family peptidase [Candidatus Acidiferrales bacterium]
MSLNSRSLRRVSLALSASFLLPVLAFAQANYVPSRITRAVDENKLTVLPGNVHPLARPQYDRGPAPPDLAMDHMMLVLKKSPAQEAALERLLAGQQDRNSPNYHKWLTPAQFGEMFGPSDDDIQTISTWLGSHGFRIDEVSKGRTLIEFSGNAGNVQEAFHAAIHKYVVNGHEHWANSSNPSIPTALTPVVAGVSTLHNFFPKPASRSFGTFQRNKKTGEVKRIRPQFSFPASGGCGELNSTSCFAIGPSDFAAIYGVQSLWASGIDGTGVTIAVVGQSDINPADISDFRSLFGLPVNNPTVIHPGTPPGIQQLSGDEGESDLDLEWAGGVAKGATIDFVTSASSQTTSGVDLSAAYVVNTLGNTVQIMSESYDLCEASLGNMENANLNSMWQQGQSEGITIVIAAGDSGATGCDFQDQTNPNAQPASGGLAVNGLASTPYDTAVGGTDFDQLSNFSSFWNTSNSTTGTGGTQLSAKGYIPETTWNDSCTNLIYGMVGFNASPLTNCNNTSTGQGGLAAVIAPIGGGGGLSNCAVQNAQGVCQGYAQPAWQTGSGIAAGGARAVPDVSLFAGDGLLGSFYVVCQQDADSDNSGAACDLNSPFAHFEGVGGTSASAQAFAGIMALVVQNKAAHGPVLGLGLANPSLYTLAAAQAGNCNSSNSPASTCIFYDTTKGTIAQPCVQGSSDCAQANPALAHRAGFLLLRSTNAIAVFACFVCIAFLLFAFQASQRKWSSAFALFAFSCILGIAACGGGGGGSGGGTGGGGGNTIGITTGYSAGTGYDMATGLGSVNAANLAHNWP